MSNQSMESVISQGQVVLKLAGHKISIIAKTELLQPGNPFHVEPTRIIFLVGRSH